MKRLVSDPEMCLVFWIDEEHVDEKTMAFYETELVMIVPCLSKHLDDRLELLQPLSCSSSTACGTGFHLNKNNTFQGRFRIVANPRNPQKLLPVLQRAGLMSYPLLLLSSNMIVSGLTPSIEIQAVRMVKSDVLLSSRDIDIRNFCHMASVIWLNPAIDPSTLGSPPREKVEEARRHILSGSARHGTFVFELASVSAFTEFIETMRSWLCRAPSLRILFSHHNFRTLTGHEPLPDYSSSTITQVLLSLRTKMGFAKVPVLVFSTELSALHDSVYSLPICKPTSSLDETIDLAAMWPLAWAPDWSLFDALVKEATWTGEVHIFDISCFNLLSSNGTIDPYIITTIHGQKKYRFKCKKQDRITEPSWASLNWTIPVSSSDTLHVRVMSHDTFAKDSCLGEVYLVVKDCFKSPMPLMETTMVLHPPKAHSKTSGTITIKLGLTITSRSGEHSHSDGSSEEMKSSDAIIEEARSVRIRGAHFGRPLGDSLHRSEEIGVRHIAHTCILYIMENGLNSVGIFRVVGSRKKVREAQITIDAEREVQLDDPFVTASLLKLYLRELPDPIISHNIYKQFLQLQHIPSYKQLLPEMKLLLRQLSQVHRDLLADILELMKTIAESESINMMNTRNLATTIAPTLCISKSMNTLIDINELLLDTNAVIDLVQVAIHYNRYLFPESLEDEELPKELDQIDESSTRLDRSPPSSPEQSDDTS